MLRPPNYLYQEADHQLAIAEDPDEIPEGWPILYKHGQILQGIPEGKVFNLIIGVPSAIVVPLQITSRPSTSKTKKPSMAYPA